MTPMTPDDNRDSSGDEARGMLGVAADFVCCLLDAMVFVAFVGGIVALTVWAVAR